MDYCCTDKNWKFSPNNEQIGKQELDASGMKDSVYNFFKFFYSVGSENGSGKETTTFQPLLSPLVHLLPN